MRIDERTKAFNFATKSRVCLLTCPRAGTCGGQVGTRAPAVFSFFSHESTSLNVTPVRGPLHDCKEV